MIRFMQGNLLEAHAEALVNTVNEKGVMGKGIALMFKDAFPSSARAYEAAAKRGEVQVGRVLVTRREVTGGPRWIIHLPTKKHWRNPSKIEWITDGLRDLARVISELGIRSIALPPLGTGNGKLEWGIVRREIEAALGEFRDVDVLVFEPSPTYMNTPKRVGVEELTPARALIAEFVRRYSVLGIDCSHLEIQKLAWFLERVILAMGLEDPLRLEFKANRYGPYTDQLRHLLNTLDGSYLHSEKRMADVGPFDPILFEERKREQIESYLQSSSASRYLPALDKATDVIHGFESPLGMELLATVDWLLHRRHTDPNVAAIKGELRRWPGSIEAGERKLRLFDDRLIKLAVDRLTTEQPIDRRTGM